MKPQDHRRTETIFAVYRNLSPFEQKEVDARARRVAEGIVSQQYKDDRPSLVGVFEIEVARVKTRIWEETILSQYASRIQAEAEAVPEEAKDPSWPGWPGFQRPERRLSGPATQGPQEALGSVFKDVDKYTYEPDESH